MTNKLEAAARISGLRKIALAGGVAANGALRESAQRMAAGAGYEIGIAPLRYCGDNAAMIGAAALHHKESNGDTSFALDADPNLSLR